MAAARPNERAADGGPGFLLLPWRAMKRSTYAGRVCGSMLFLSLDIVMNLITDTIHWGRSSVTEEALSAGTARLVVVNQDVIGAIILLILGIVVRIGYVGSTFLAVVSTAHFRLGRYSELMHDFGGAMVVNMAAFVAMITLRIVRIVRAARMDAVFDNANSFWDAPPLGPFYSTLWVLHIFLTALHYVKGVSALRRLAASGVPHAPRRAQPHSPPREESVLLG